MFKVEVVVVGAGVIGLAIARALALRGLQVILLEKESSLGTGTSSRNSEVIHSGIHYEPESLKAQLCICGRRRLYGYCADRGIPHRQCGKLIVATEPGEDEYLGRLLQRADSNEVEGIALIGTKELKRLEPEIRGSCALLSRNTGMSTAMRSCCPINRRRGRPRHNRIACAGPRGGHGRPHDPTQDRRERIHGA